MQGKLPKDLPIFLDSPLAIKATEIFRRYRSYLDSETQALLKKGEDPLELPQLKFSSTTAQSMEINVMKGPAIVISASGMANAGRIKHHLKHNLWRPGASIVFVGFQAAGTPGRRIVDGAKTIRFFGEDISVKAKVFTIGGFSAHAGQDQLLEWLTNFQNKKMQIFLVHGEISAQDQLASLIREKLGFAVTIPQYLEEINLLPGVAVQEVKKPPAAEPKISWELLLDDLGSKISRLAAQQEKLKSLPASRQIEIINLLLEANQRINDIKSDS
jgi:metallo-beta-lactamase family protein